MSNQDGSGLQVSVVMAVFNGERTLEATLASVLGQQDCSLEFIVVDDGSTDGTAAILDAWAAREPRLRVLHQENQGLTASLVTGCRLARAEFIARQDCGDSSRPRRLSGQLKRMSEDARAVVCGCDFSVVGPDGEHMYLVNQSSSGARDLVSRSGTLVCAPHHGSAMFRRAAYFDVGEYRTDFRYAQDIDLWSRLLEVGEIAWVDEPLYEVRFELTSITGTYHAKQRALREIIVRAAAARRENRSDAQFLAEAREIGRDRANAGSAAGKPSHSHASYFVGSCLFRRRDARARRYLWDAMTSPPRQLLALPKWLLTFVWARRSV